MQLGRFIGIIFLIMGGFLTAFFDTMLREDGSAIKILLAGPPFALWGLALLFFPGGNITTKESKTQQKDPGVFIEEAPKSHKIAWVIALLAGLVLALNWGIFIK